MAPATHILRHSSEHGRWEMLVRQPPPHLAGHVLALHGFVEEAPRPVRRRELPFVGAVLILNLGAPFRLGGPADPEVSTALGSFAAGLSDEYALSESTGTACCLQVNLTPLGAYRFFGLPMEEIANRVVALDDLLGPAAGSLADQLHAAPSWEARFALLESALAVRIERGKAASPAVSWALARLAASAGGAAIGALAADLGWSRKRLIARFREEVGLPPKAVARVLRFEGVIRRLDAAPGDARASWAEIAQDCGYYDQAHFNHDFRLFAGTTPGDLLRQRLAGAGTGPGDGAPESPSSSRGKSVQDTAAAGR